MGHTRVGRLPRTAAWREVVNQLSDPNVPLPAVSEAALAAAATALRNNRLDIPATLCFDLVIFLASAARSDSFEAALSKRGLSVEDAGSPRGFIAQCTQHVRDLFAQSECSYLSSALVARTFSETISKHLASQTGSLFGFGSDAVRDAFRTLYRGDTFGDFAQVFFGTLLRRTLSYFLSKEIADHVGPQARFEGVTEALQFEKEMAQYSLETAAIVRDYARDWYGGRLADGPPTQRDIRGFVRYGLEKIYGELVLEAEDW